MFGANPGALGQCTTGGGCSFQSTIIAPPVQILSQKICNQTNCGIAGTTSGERQWGNDLTNINKNNPEEKPIANIKNAMNVNITN